MAKETVEEMIKILDWIEDLAEAEKVNPIEIFLCYEVDMGRLPDYE